MVSLSYVSPQVSTAAGLMNIDVIAGLPRPNTVMLEPESLDSELQLVTNKPLSVCWHTDATAASKIQFGRAG